MSAVIGAATAQGPALASTPDKKTPEHSGLTFGDLLDVINPLQHIPVISTIYRRLTGDTMSPTAEIAGGALYGGIIGTVASIADVLFTEETGKDFGETVLGWLGFTGKDETQLAAATVRAKSVAAPAPGVALPSSLLRPAAVSAIAPRAASTPMRLAPAPRPQAARPAAGVVPGLPSLMNALQKQGVDPTVAARAAFAYRSAIDWKAQQNASAAPAY
jgi:hypothetical protein